MKSPLSLLLIASVLVGCGEKSEPAPPVSKAAMTVSATAVQQKTMARAIEAQGLITPWEEAVISARVSGLPLVEVNGEVGDHVKKGQLLARFDSRIVSADLAQASANLAQTIANAKQAAANRDRIIRMQGKGAVSEQDLQTAQTQVEMTEAQRDMAQAQLNAQEIRLMDCEVRAVDDGVISSRNALLGQVAPVGSEMFRLIRQDKLEWHAALNVHQLAQVKQGQHVIITLQNGIQLNGIVRQIAPALDSLSRLGQAFVDIEKNPAARAGMFAGGLIELDQQQSLVVPAESVVLRDGRSSVFKLDAENKVTQLPVETGRREGNMIEIRSGIVLTDHIAVRGAGFLVDGDRVRIADMPASSAEDKQLTQQEDAP